MSCYCVGGIVLARSIPFILRHTEFFKYFDREVVFFHKTNGEEKILEIKQELLKELKGKNDLPQNNEAKLVILELNIGSATNVSYYPDDSILIGTDFIEENDKMVEIIYF